MAKFYIQHLTEYTYSSPVYDRANQMMLYPINDLHQHLITHHIKISRNPSIQTHTDSYNNTIGSFSILSPHDHLVIHAMAEVVTEAVQFPTDTAKLQQQWDHLKAKRNDTALYEFLTFTYFKGLTEIASFISTKETTVMTPYQVVMQLCDFVYRNFKYVRGVTHVHSTLDEVWKMKTGVCQDFTNILIQLVRFFGIPAKYVSGYVCDEEGLKGEAATHAWAEVYLPFYGWLGLDPTNNCMVNDQYVRLCTGRTYKDCSPVKGIYRGTAKEQMLVRVYVGGEKMKLQPHTHAMARTDTTHQYGQDHTKTRQQQQ